MQASFNDQRVLVIGGSSGIGAAAARAFAVLDADVTIASRDANKLAGRRTGDRRPAPGSASGARYDGCARGRRLLRRGRPVRPRRHVGRAHARRARAQAAARRRAGGDGQQVLGRIPRRARGAHRAGRVAHVRLRLPERAAERERGAARRDQRGARGACARARARARAGAREHRVAGARRDGRCGRSSTTRRAKPMYAVGGRSGLPRGASGSPRTSANAIVYLAGDRVTRRGRPVLVDGGAARSRER
ncbi:putative dehydrogenase [Burkholderia pseudomallei NCTC 13179]|nr:putative dehydrogenase [Burkholderia pseudomallei NCTC 13179]